MFHALDQLGVPRALETLPQGGEGDVVPGLERRQQGWAHSVGLPVQVGTLRHQSLDRLRDPGRPDLGVPCFTEDVRQPAELVADGIGDGAIDEGTSGREDRPKAPGRHPHGMDAVGLVDVSGRPLRHDRAGMVGHLVADQMGDRVARVGRPDRDVAGDCQGMGGSSVRSKIFALGVALSNARTLSRAFALVFCDSPVAISSPSLARRRKAYSPRSVRKISILAAMGPPTGQCGRRIRPRGVVSK